MRHKLRAQASTMHTSIHDATRQDDDTKQCVNIIVGTSLDNLTTLVNADGVPNYMCDVLICTSDPYQLVRFPTNLSSLIQPP